MADDAYKTYIRDMLEYYRSERDRIDRLLIARGAVEEADALTRAYEEAEDERYTLEQRYEKEIAKFRLNGILSTEKEASEYKLAKAKEENAYNLRTQLNALKEISKDSQKNRDAEEKILQRKIAIQEKINNLQSDGEESGGLKKVLNDAQATLLKGFDQFADKFSDNFNNIISNMSNVINSTISTYANYRGTMNARLQGSDKTFQSLSDTLDKVAYSGLLSASDLYSNLNTLVGKGITQNVEQLALFETLKDDIAPTFSTMTSSLRSIVRVQQEDSTAMRLGLESYLTQFLNEFTETTEYLESTFDSVADSLYEASSTMSASTSTEFEYIVQKWLGVLSGEGMSDSTVKAIAEAIGQLGSGNIEALGSSSMQNLVVMAASKAGLSYADILNTGLTADTTNQLMRSIVEYLQTLGSASSNVVKSQLAKTFGVSISDLVASANLSDNEISSVFSDVLTSTQMYQELYSQFDELTNRLGTAKILENLYSNYQYATGTDIANNPVLYSLWKITDLIQSTTGGINIPTISVMGTSVDLNTTLENLMKTGIIGASTIGGIGNILTGLASTLNGSTLLTALGVEGASSYVSRESGLSSSYSTLVASTDSEAYTESTLNAAQDAAQEDLNQASTDVDSTLKLLQDMGFASIMNEINSNIKDIKNDGIQVTNMPYSDSITGLNP